MATVRRPSRARLYLGARQPVLEVDGQRLECAMVEVKVEGMSVRRLIVTLDVCALEVVEEKAPPALEPSDHGAL